MQRPRIAPLDPPYAPELAEELSRFMPPGIPPLRLFRTLAHNPRVLRKFRLGSLLDRGSLEKRDREIVILTGYEVVRLMLTEGARRRSPLASGPGASSTPE